MEREPFPQELVGPLRVAGLEVLGASGEDHVIVMGFRDLGQGGSPRDSLSTLGGEGLHTV